MFGRDKRKAPANNSPVTNFDDKVIKWALSGSWLKLAVSRFEAPFSTKNTSDPFAGFDDNPKAYGVVHFDVGTDALLRCELTLDRSVDDKPSNQIGTASLTTVNDEEDPHILLQATVSDPLGKIEEALRVAFEFAALRQDRFVHVIFWREKLDADAIIAELKEKKYGGDHPLSRISFNQQIILPKAPVWSWAWSLRI